MWRRRRCVCIAGAMRPVMDWRINKTKWVVLRWPTAGDGPTGANEHRGLRGFISSKVCTLDYARMIPA